MVSFGNVVDDDGFRGLCRSRGKGWSRPPAPRGHQAEFDFIAHRAANPPLLGDARHGGKTHAGRSAHHFQNARNRRDTLHGSYVRAEVASS